MSNLQATTETQFQNILNSYINNIDNRQSEFNNLLNSQDSIDSILNKWQFNNYLTKATKSKTWNIEALKSYIYNRRLKQDFKSLLNFNTQLNAISQAKDVESIILSIEWKKSQMWGNNPQAEAKVCYKDNTCEYYTSSRISGAGYCKQSTAFAEAINQVNGILKCMSIVKNDNINANKDELFGYGTGYGEIPNLAGGVGVSCYYRIFEKIGYKMTKIASGKTFDVWTIEKIK